MRLRPLSIIQYQNVTNRHYLNRLWLPIGAFNKQLNFYSKKNFHVLTMDEAVDYMERKKKEPGFRPIALTFDNGYMDFYEYVYPMVLDFNFPCTVLISPLKVGERMNIGEHLVRYLTWNNLKELITNNVIIGAYEDGALNLNDIPIDMVKKHITNHKKMLEDRLGIEVRYFGVKEGVPSDEIRDLLISEGYRAFLTECPTNRRPDVYSIGRIQVDDDDFNIFLTKISRTYLFFKDKKSWKYVREYSLDKAVHKMSKAWDRLRGIETS